MAAAAATAALAAQGAETSPATDSVTLEGVTVTAIKQSANLRSQATASTVLSRRDVERNEVTGAKAASGMVPNLYIPDYGSRMTSTIYVRGIGARIDQPAVGLSIDNVPVLSKENYDFDLLDISRVEMLRGPQSTLYGRNTMGGAINIYTLSAMSYQGTRLLAEYASGQSYRAGASHYARLGGNVWLGAGAHFTSTDGQFTNQHNGRKCDWERQGYARAKLEWQPSSRVLVSNSLSLTMSRQGGYPYEYMATGQISYNDTCFYRRTAVLDGLTVSADLGSVQLSGISSFQYIDDNMTLDQDFTPLPYFTLTQARREWALTQDVVARSRGGEEQPYQWLAGLFGFYRHSTMDAPVTFLNTGISELIENHRNKANPDYPISWDERSFVLGSHFRLPLWGVAAYHQSTLDLGKVVLTAGLRVDYERAGLSYTSTTHTGYSTIEAATGATYSHTAIDIDDRGRMHKEFVQLLPKFTATWRPWGKEKPHTLYASVSKGSKSGGYNTQMFSDVLQQRLMGVMGIGASYDIGKVVGYKPEKAWNYEAGGHFECWQGRVKSDLAVFYIDCTDRQLTVFPDGTTTGRVMTNAGRTRNWGAELALQVRPTEALGLNMSYGFTSARFVDYSDGKADYAHRHIPYCPSHTLWAEAYYEIATRGCGQWLKSVTLDANVQGAGEIYWNEANTARQPFYALLGGSVTLHGRHYSLQLWGRNLTDTAYRTFYFVSIGHEFLQRGKSRQAGATLRILF